MTTTQLNTFRNILEARQAELRPSMRRRDDIAVERASDILDEVQLAAEREFATRSLERAERLSRDLRAALARIDEGTYGTCVNCEEEIGMKRLNALPWTPLCIRCQELSDNDRRADIDVHGYFLADAA
jgi:RNA polymerase-binding transcription factor